jgi:hypothetical protein
MCWIIIPPASYISNQDLFMYRPASGLNFSPSLRRGLRRRRDKVLFTPGEARGRKLPTHYLTLDTLGLD